ncbi:MULTISPECIES: hypothetical protein [unclassified Corallococcus]|uniref:hypothetical protein n=1 Tax=unclassified Corallococcus TaxID=2685029 RepID=UPI001A8F4E1C|nr:MULTISPECIES: hypothetical protein [unclassified Corallococcus]MBN9683699.1 hypothetical protein [Corallococcus sp. NCSPR001]WAS84793.1 hypothetical protein O0N60_36700 [Corallococcus sp. NCRR]
MAREELHPGWLPLDPEEAEGPLLDDAFHEEDEAFHHAAGADAVDDLDAFDFAVASY